MENKVHELRELQRMAAELADMIEAIKDEIKANMTETGTDSLTGTDWMITWKQVTSSRIDTKALQRELPDLVKRYTVETTTRRFCIA